MGFLNVCNELIGKLSEFLYTYILIILLVGTGVYFTVRTKFVQIRMLPEAIRILTEKKKDDTGVSSFQALMISTASRVGTGNIAGVATALAAGGAGAIFWMWLLAIIGSASAFVESTLAQTYKTRDGKEFRGGPAYYIQYALGKRWLGIVFSILLIACFAFGFNALQSYNVSSAFEYYIGTDYARTAIPAVIGGILAVATALVIFGGVHRIGVITSGIVPVMAVLYILLGLFITLTNLGRLPGIFALIFTEAFDFRSIAGGFAGSCVMLGIKRGLFSNEAGMGSAPNAGATADVSHPAKQGLVQMLSVFIDTILICTTTAMMLLNYGVIDPELTGMPFVQQAVKAEVGELGIHFITASIFLFAFSSLVGNYCYAESNLKFIKDDKKLLFVFRIICVLVVFAGALANFDTVWNLADVLMGFMAIVNIIAILLLGGVAVRILKDYQRQRKDGKDPVFRPKDLGIKNTRCWKEQ
ncbi:MAG: alanine/glycine:cation symporter family protein [Eubacteriales bacterium]|nr:alanine/glycine:cation symporter family protein [Eubacteriales bacterium]